MSSFHYYILYYFLVGHNKLNQVQNVRAHVYYPLLNNQSVISAQVIWTSLTSILQPTSYEVQIFTADADKLHIKVSIYIEHYDNIHLFEYLKWHSKLRTSSCL